MGDVSHMPIPSMEQLQSIWSNLSEADRIVLLGHSKEDLSLADNAKLMKILSNLKNKRQ